MEIQRCPYCGHPDTHATSVGCLHESEPPHVGYCDCTETWPPAPDLPYAGTSGWSCSDTSRERAQTQDANGTTADRQTAVLQLLAYYRDSGLTWKELANLTGWHHGQASGVLSVLHKVGKIARLLENRNRCAVYVLPQCVNGRDVATQGRKRLSDDERRAVAELRGSVDAMRERTDVVPSVYLTQPLAESLLSIIDRLA